MQIRVLYNSKPFKVSYWVFDLVYNWSFIPALCSLYEKEGVRSDIANIMAYNAD